MKRILLSIATTLALAAAAMPTRDEQRKAAPIVAELMNPLVADFRAKKKTAAEVGDVAMAYAKEANTEGAKFLLLKGAIWYFAQAKEDAKAVAAIAALGAEVKELPPEVLRNDVLKPAIDHVSEQNVPGLFAQFRSASAQMEIAKLGPSVRRNRADESTRRRYAELLTVTGDWKAALDVFAKLDDAKDAAKAESGGKTLAPAGDFWWSYKPTEPTAADAIKAHAVALYRQAIASGELTGLKKVVAEKRIASVPFADRFAAAETSTASAPSAAPSANALYCVIDLSAGPNASKYPVSYLAAEPKGGWTDEYKTKKLVLRRIEPGKFMMGGEHKVTLTKPFYCGVFEVTQKQYELVTGGNPSEYKGDMRPVENISWNMIRGDSATYNLPSSVNVDSSTFMGKIQTRTGLNFDLPTEAQWEYACRAGTTSKYNNSGDSVTDLKKLGRYEGNQSDGKGGYSQHTTVGSYQSNAWGLYDMHGNVWEFCLDGSEGNRVIRGGGWGNRASVCTPSSQSAVRPWRASGSGFRLCMNPEAPLGVGARGNAASTASGKQPNALYCVIDLSAGPNAGKYTVSYLAAEPKGGWTDEYKTKKLVLRRIEPGKFLTADGKVGVTLTKPFYCGVFEVTQKQYELVTGDNPSEFRGDTRPVERVSWNMVRGDSSTYDWPSSVKVDPNSFMGKIQARTGLNFDLPTEAQWEYACRAGTTSKFNNGGDSEDDMKKLGRYKGNQSDGKGGYSQHATVGSYPPNAWGLYDMHGNIREWCLNWLGNQACPSSGTRRVQRGGYWDVGADHCPSSRREHSLPWSHTSIDGFRLCMNPDGPVGAGGAASVSAAPRDGVPSNALYCVIDLSAGPDASKYPVSYLAAEPKGGWTDEYKTKKLVLRRIEPGTFKMGGEYEVTLTKPFYCGVFEVTQKQYELVTGGNPSQCKGDMRPVERVSWNMIRGDSSTYNWPSSVKVDPNSFMGKIQARTGLNFDLPTEAQWEYTCRAGTTGKYNNGGDTEADLKKLGRCKDNRSDGKGGYADARTTTVGSYQPNVWGLYDMHGNVWEWCLDWHGNLSSRVADPLGASAGEGRVDRGGCWWNYADRCTSSYRSISVPSSVNNGDGSRGFRLCLNPEVSVGASARGSGTLAASGGLYCVIDLSAGPDAGKYPVSYLAAEPKGGWTDEYKTKKLVLRRIEPGKFKMCGQYDVTLTKPYYMGVFEVTQKQYELVTGSNPSQYKGDMRPVEKVSYDMIRGKNAGAKWPASSAVDSSSFIGKIRERTGIEGFDLPTEAQWEYACRAGTTSKYNNGGDTEADLKKLGRFLFNQAGRAGKEPDASFTKHEPDGKGGCSERHTVVGSYLPNAWGLYDMHGNVWEWCLDWPGDLSSGMTEPVGSSSGSFRVKRGGSWVNGADFCTSSFRSYFGPSGEDSSLGFRLVRTLSN